MTKHSMIVFNTTYCIDKSAVSEALGYLRDTYIPSVLISNLFTNPRLCRVLGSNDDEGENYSLQFEVESVEVLEKWYAEKGRALHEALVNRFGQQVAAFATLLQPLEVV